MKKIMMLIVATFCLCAAYAQRPAGKPMSDEKTQSEVQTKVRTILTELSLKDKQKSKALEAVLKKRLMSLYKIQAAYEKTVKFATDSMDEDRRAHIIQNVGNRRMANLHKEHFVFEAELRACLEGEEVEQVKEIMTAHEFSKHINALPTTLPNFTETQKKYAIERLKAAREYALDTISPAAILQCFDEAMSEIKNSEIP